MSRTSRTRGPRELLGWMLLMLGAGALQLPALGRMAQHDVYILDFETMRTTANAGQTLVALGTGGASAARQQLIIDFGFLVLYALVLSALCAAVAGRARPGSLVAKAGPWFAKAAVVAAACDFVENVALLVVLASHPEQPWPGAAAAFAYAKFALLAAVGVFLAVGWLVTAVKPREREKTDAEELPEAP